MPHLVTNAPDLARHQEVAHGAEGTKSRCQRQEAAVIAKSAGRPRKLLKETRVGSESPPNSDSRHLSIQPANLFIHHLSFYLTIYLSVYPSIYPSVHLSLKTYLCIYLYMHACMHASVHAFITFVHMYRSVCGTGLPFSCTKRVCRCVGVHIYIYTHKSSSASSGRFNFGSQDFNLSQVSEASSRRSVCTRASN